MIDDIQKLREATGAGVMECKRALAEAGTVASAQKLLYERGLTKADIKAERKTGAGVLEAYIHSGRIGVLLEMRCETDFVARGELFRALAHDIAMHISAMRPMTVDELRAQPFMRDESITVNDLIKNVIAKTGENIVVERFTRYAL